MPDAALWKAVEDRQTDRVIELLEAGSDPNDERRGETCFGFALGRGRYDEVILALFDRGGDLSRVPKRALNLVWAVLTGREDVVAAFLEAGASSGVKSPMGTPVSVAAQRGHLEILDRLIEAGADLDDGTLLNTPLSAALEGGHEETALRLIRAGASLDPALVPGAGLAARAAQSGLVEVLRALAAGDCDLEQRATFQEMDAETFELRRTSNNATPLMVAARAGHADCVDVLIEAGVALHAIDDDGYGVVEIARAHGHEPIARRLVEAGAPETAERPAPLALLMAAESGDAEAARAALARGAAVDTHDAREEQQGRTPLMLAAGAGHAALVALLLEAGAEVSRSDTAEEPSPGHNAAFLIRDDVRGRTALHLACAEGRIEAVQRLLEAGADIAAADLEKYTPLWLAAACGHTRVVRSLLEAGADPNQRGPSRSTPLHGALGDAHADAALALIAAGAKVGLKDGDGDTPLHIAALLGARPVLEALLDAGADPSVANRQKEKPSANAKGELRALLRAAERGERVAAAETEAEDEDVEATRMQAALARTPERPTPGANELAERYERERVRERLRRDAASPDFQALLPEVAEACGSEAEEQLEQLGGYRFHVRTGRLDESGLEALQQGLLERGAYVFCCGDGQPWGTPGSLALLPTRDRFDALAMLGTNGANEDKSTGDILHWLAHREQVQPFALTWVTHDTLKGRFEGPIEDAEELACSMYELCSDIVDQGTETLERLVEELERSQRLYFWWD